MKRTILTLLITTFVNTISSQTISLHFPHFAGAEYDFYLFQGITSDTIQSGTIGKDGNLTLTIPEQYKGYKGMSRWLLRSGGGLDFVINGKNFSVSCTEEMPNDDNIIYKENPENDFISQRYLPQQQLLEKIEVIRNTQRVYQADTRSDIYHTVENELKLLKETFRQQQQEKRESPLYAAHYLRISDFLNYTPLYSLSDTEEEHKSEMLRFVEEELDMDVLFTTGLWRNVILQCSGLYENESNFISTMLTKLQQTTSLLAYEQLAEALISICEQHGWNEQAEQLTYFLINDGRIKSPTGKLKQVMTLYQLTKGSKAPGLSQGKLPKNKTLLVFYESGCGSCVSQMQQLNENYALLKEKGYEVVSVSAETDLLTFKHTSENYPWKAKYCDGEGFAGQDFQNYGIIGTPTMFVLDKKGTIQGRYARLEDTGILTD